MKKKILLLLSFFSAICAFSENNKFSLFVEPYFGTKIGQIDEYVFLKESNYDSDKLSELNWDIMPELYAGFSLGGSFWNIFVETSFLFGIPTKTGTMADSDWMNNYSDYVSLENSKKTENYKTNYSESDNYLDHDFSFNLNVGYDFSVAKLNNFNANIKPFLGFQYENFKFNGEDGTCWYGKGTDGKFYVNNGYYAEWNDEENQYSEDFDGNVISYKRINFVFWTGLNLQAEFFTNFGISAGFKFSPYLYSESTDNHILTGTAGTDYLDVISAFCGYFNWNLGFFYNFNKRNSIYLGADYVYMRILRGDDYQKSPSEEKFQKSSKSSIIDGGIGAHYLNISLSYKFNIF